MKRGRTIILFIVLVIGISLLFYLSHYTQSSVTPINYPSDINPSSSSSAIDLNENQLTSGEPIEVKAGENVNANIDGNTYSFKIQNIDSVNNKVDILLNNFPGFSLAVTEQKKLDLNFDNVYEISVSVVSVSSGSAQLSFKLLNEKEGVIETVNSQLEKTLESLQKNYNIQSGLIFLIVLVVVIFVIAYILKTFLMPAIKNKKINERQSPTDALDFLLDEFSKTKDDKVKSKKLYHRIKHLYNYLSPEEKSRFRTRVKNIEKIVE